MDNTTTLPLSVLKNKVLMIDREIRSLQQDKTHFERVIEILSRDESVPPKKEKEAQDRLEFDTKEISSPVHIYDSNLTAGDLIVEILRTEKKPMSWKEIFAVFAKVKPDVSKRVFTVTLSAINRKRDKYLIVHYKKHKKYGYNHRKEKSG